MRNIPRMGKRMTVLVVIIAVVIGGIYFGILAGSAGNQMVPITKGYRSAIFNDAKYVGPADKNMEIWITIALKWKNEATLDRYLQDVNNVRSPMYHKFLSYDDFKMSFAPPEDVYNEMVSWIKSKGVHVEETYDLRNAITIHDKIGKIEKLLDVKFGVYENSNPRYLRTFFAPTSAPKFPAKFAPYIEGLNGLDNATRYHLNYYHYSSKDIDFLTGADVMKMYHVLQLVNDSANAGSSNKHIFATGLRVATVLWDGGAAPFDPNAVEYYFKHAIPKWMQDMGVMSTVHWHGTSGAHAPGSNTDGYVSGENELDLEMVGTLAPGVDAYCVYGPGQNGHPAENNFPDNEYNYILNTLAQDNSKVLVAVSNSWGDGDTQGSAATDNAIKALNAMGITVLASSGDDGDTDSPGYPSIDAYDTFGVIAVGGTTPFPNGVDRTTLDDTATMGYNTYTSNPRKKEIVWYDISSTGAGGNQAHHWGTQSGVSSSYAEPSWQKNYVDSIIGATGKHGRATADIAAMGNHTLIYVSDGQGNTKWSAIAGTSVACPVVAGVVAMMDAYIGVKYRVSNHGLGFLLPTIYKLGYDYYHNGKYSSSPPFYDVTETPSGYHSGETAYWAKSGWDLATGWGVINAWEFVHDIGFTLSASTTSKSINAGNSASFYINAKFPYDWTTEVGHFVVEGLPSGATASTSPSYVHPAGNGATAGFTLTISTTSSVQSGTYTLTLTAYSYNHTTGHWGNLSSSITLTLTINGGGSGGNVPSAPLNLAAQAGDGYVKLTWNAPSDNGGSSITSYRIYRGTTSGGESYLTYVSGSTLTYTDNSVTNGVTYYYYVTAVNANGEGAKSNEVSATPHASTPSNTILLVDDDGGKDYESYFKQALSDAGYTYDVWDVSSKGVPSASTLNTYKVVIWTTGSTWENTLTSDEQNALISYLNAGGKLYLSSQDLLWDLSGGNDGSVSNTFVNNYLGVSAVANDKSYTSVKGISGDPISGAFSTLSLDYPFYNYADEITPGSSTPIFDDSSGKATAVRYDSGSFRTVFTAFSFEAVEKASATNGAQLMKNIIEWLLNGGGSSGSAPSAPLNLKAEAGDGYVTLTWNAPSSNGGSAITSYKIYRGTSSGGESYLTSVSGSTLTYTDSSVTNGVTYYYYVTAVNAKGESDKSNEVSATPQASGGNTNKKILFVDDDEGSSTSDYVIQALKDIGADYDVWDVYQIGYTPSYDDMKAYGIVIWSTGYAYQNTLTSEDQANLIKYLNNGGRLYLSSQDLLWDINGGYDGVVDNEFVNNYLGVKSVTNDVAYTKVEGVSGTFTSNLGTMNFDYPYHNYADEITLESGAVGVFKYSTHYTGSAYDHGNYKVVFTAFSFEAVEKYNADNGAAMLQSIIDWLSS